MEARLHLNDLSLGYQHSVVLLTACRIGLFEAMAHSKRPLGELAGELKVDARGLETLMLALAADGILLRETESYRIAPDFAPLLLEDSPDTQIHILNHQYNCLQRWVTLERRLKSGKPAPRHPSGADWSLRNFILGMADISRKSTAEVAQKVDLSQRKHMVDIGGGPATSSIVLARHFPNLTCTVLDLEDPLEIAREEIAKAGLSARIQTRATDYMHDEFGTGYDAAYISNIIHSLGPDETRMIFAKTHRALDPGGIVIVKDFFLDDSRTSPNYAAFFSINMLVATENGRSYTWSETEAMLREVGFSDLRRENVAMASGLIVGMK